MKTNRTLQMTLAILVGLAVVQFALGHQLRAGGPRHVASWANNPRTMAEAKDSSDEIIVGRVVQVRQADDLVFAAPGEPTGADSIPVEVVTVQVDTRHKGGQSRPARIELFHTGLSRGIAPSQRGNQPPGPPPTGARRPGRPPDQSAAASRTVILADDPPYQVGERYVLFLRNGPTVTVGGQSLATQRVLSPEGRYRIRADSTVEPISSRADFARQQRGKRLAELERLLP